MIPQVWDVLEKQNFMVHGDVIKEHHGTTLVYYFYHKQL